MDADLRTLGLDESDATALDTLARALVERRVDFRREHTLDGFVARWTALPGIDAGAAHHIALHALGHADAFPSTDLVEPSALPDERGRPRRDGDARELERGASRWRP